MSSWFNELDDYYPGSSERRGKPPALPPEPSGDSWDSSPRKFVIDGIAYEFFTIGDLAAALHRKPVTIRQWESVGLIPVTKLRSPSEHVSKRHRIYSRPLVEGILRIAAEEGILDEPRPRYAQTKFKEKVFALFRELSGVPLYGAIPLNEA